MTDPLTAECLDYPAMLEAREQIAHLKLALETSRVIGAAIGILMATCKVTYDDGFALLVGESQRSHRKLRDVALEVMTTGVLAA